MVADDRQARWMYCQATFSQPSGAGPSDLSEHAANLQSRIPERVPHSRSDHGAGERLERAGYGESTVERIAYVWADGCGHGGIARGAKPDDTRRDAHHHQLFQCVYQFRKVGGE